MEIINIDATIIEKFLNYEYDTFYWDNYRAIIKFGNNYIGLYYKDYIDIGVINKENIERHIKTIKKIWDNVDDRTWEQHMITGLFSKINRISDTQKCVPCKLDVPVISGIVLCDNFPVGVIIPKKLLNYKSLIELKEEGISFSDEEKELIFNQVELWVKSLINQGLYPSLYFGNILVNPNDYSDVILDGLDGPCVCRLENAKYAVELAKSGLDLQEQAINDFYKLKDEFFKKENSRTL